MKREHEHLRKHGGRGHLSAEERATLRAEQALRRKLGSHRHNDGNPHNPRDPGFDDSELGIAIQEGRDK
jgi:hypothetical protein